MKARWLVMLSVLTVLPGCDSTPGPNPFQECLITFTLQPAQLQVKPGDSATVSARRYNFCNEQMTSVEWRIEDTLVAQLRTTSDSSVVVRALTSGVTVAVVIDRADTLHRAGVPIIVTP